jgi:N-acetylglucosamine malate deacetylase 1
MGASGIGYQTEWWHQLTSPLGPQAAALSRERVLVVAAHPDDEILGMGGTINSHAQRGADVRILILSGGERSRRSDEVKTQAAVDGLRAAAQAAAEIVGASSVTIADFPDNAFDSVPLLDVVRLIEDHSQQFDPQIIYTHHIGDINIDHEIACRAVITAARPVRTGTPDIYSFEVRSATDFADALLTAPPFRPTTWQPLNATAVAAKHDALVAYKQEIQPWPKSRSIEAVDALMRHRGAQVVTEAAEAFVLLRSVRSPISGN